jgi:hypothetical protein
LFVACARRTDATRSSKVKLERPQNRARSVGDGSGGFTHGCLGVALRDQYRSGLMGGPNEAAAPLS